MRRGRSSSIVAKFAILAVAALCGVLASGGPSAAAQPTDPAAHCESLKGPASFTADGLHVSITSAKVTKVYDDLPEVCLVDGYTAPAVGFRIAMPMANWNGKYLQTGCGGACGTTKLFFCDEALNRGYACLATDMGHTSTTADWDWAYNNLQGKVDFAFRSTHLAVIIGKALTTVFYGETPSKAYFYGCSTGGRQGYLEAEMFPADFDGIIAGAPPLSETGSGLQLAWSMLSNTRPDGSLILNESDARLIHAAVLADCDMNDGVKDGLMGDPRACRFDPAEIACAKKGSAGGDGACLTPEKLDAVRKIYGGPVDSAGHAIGHQGGVPVGSELAWIGDYVAKGARPPQYAYFIQEFMRYMAFNPAPGGDFKLATLDFDRDPARMGESEKLYSASNPDLRAFKAKGGKLISFQGWGDTSVVPGGTVDFYETVTRTMGGPKSTLDFYRLFTIPGGRHCSSDGAGAEAVNYLPALEAWVEAGKAPEVLLGQNYDRGDLPLRALHFPLDPKRVRFTRPVYPYPAVAHYAGAGDPNDAANYKPVVMAQ